MIKNKLNLKTNKIYFLAVICGVMAVASIFMTITSSTNGAEIASLQKKEVELMNKQQELQQTLVESLSINSLQEQSTGLGFTKVKDLVYVTDSSHGVAAKLP